MKKVQFLAIGRNPVVLQKLLRFINENPEWEANGTVDDESAIIIFNQKEIHVVVWVDELSAASETRLATAFKEKAPEIIFIHHYGDSTGLLAWEIQEAFTQNNFDAKALNVVDEKNDAAPDAKNG
ncbi:MAG: hypothetical protein ABIR03_05800 [Ginsengibacter sp.]